MGLVHGPHLKTNPVSWCAAGTLFVQVDQQQMCPSGWPVLLQAAACARIALSGQGHPAAAATPMHISAGEPLSVLFETQDALGQRICQVLQRNSQKLTSQLPFLWMQVSQNCIHTTSANIVYSIGIAPDINHSRLPQPRLSVMCTLPF